MNNPLFRIFIAIFLLASLLSGCKSKKGVVKKRKKKSESAVVIEKVKDLGIDYNSIEIKGSAKTEFDGKKYNLTIIFRNYKNREIWVSVRAMLGIEVARLYCTPENVKVFSRLAGIKESVNWSKMTDILGYPIDYYTFQGMMTRTLFIPDKPELEELSHYIQRNSKSGILLVPDYNSNSFMEDNKKANFWPQFLVDKESYVLVKTRIVPTRNEWQLEAYYGNNINDDFAGLPNRFKVTAIDEGQDLELSLKIQSVIINEDLKMPFQW